MKARYWFVVALIFGLAAIYGLRVNAQHALLLKNQILEKDHASLDVGSDINVLQQFVFSHMNSGVSFVLLDSFNRALLADQTSGITGQLYAAAQANCDHEGVSSVVQAQCVEDFLNQRLARSRPNAHLPQESQYSYSFAAPNWSPDLAGLSLLGAGLLSLTSGTIYVVGLVRNRAS